MQDGSRRRQDGSPRQRTSGSRRQGSESGRHQRYATFESRAHTNAGVCNWREGSRFDKGDLLAAEWTIDKGVKMNGANGREDANGNGTVVLN